MIITYIKDHFIIKIFDARNQFNMDTDLIPLLQSNIINSIEKQLDLEIKLQFFRLNVSKRYLYDFIERSIKIIFKLIQIVISMGGINGVVNNQSKKNVSYILKTQKIVLKHKTIETNQQLSSKIQAELQKLGEVAVLLKKNCVEQLEASESEGVVRVGPGSVVFQSLQQLEADKYYFSVFVEVSGTSIWLIKNCLVKTSQDVCIKVRENLSFKNMSEEQVNVLIKQNDLTTEK